MNPKVSLISLGTVLAVVGTIYAFSDYQNGFSCKSLLSLTGECLSSTSCSLHDFSHNEASFDLGPFDLFYNEDTSEGFTKHNFDNMILIKDRKISFFEVPLVCHAAPTIGCGSRAKPVLKDFEASESVKEAWLNRPGTIIAVVWKENVDVENKAEVTKSVFDRHQLNALELSDVDYSKVKNAFEDKKDWLKGSDVDKLSKEEASIFADKLIVSIKEKTALNASEETQIKTKITDTFYDFFLNYESLKELGDPQAYKLRLEEIISFGDQLLGEGKMPSIDELWKSCANISKSPDCCDTGSSCKVPKS